MGVEAFLDTNILVYAYDADAGEKREIALGLVERAWLEPGKFSVSVQVLQELYVNLTRKGQTHETASEIVHHLSSWPVVENSVSLLHAALSVKARWQTSFWDALIVAAANQSGAPMLLSEDLNHGQNYGGCVVQNPFKNSQN